MSWLIRHVSTTDEGHYGLIEWIILNSEDGFFKMESSQHSRARRRGRGRGRGGHYRRKGPSHTAPMTVSTPQQIPEVHSSDRSASSIGKSSPVPKSNPKHSKGLKNTCNYTGNDLSDSTDKDPSDRITVRVNPPPLSCVAGLNSWEQRA